VATHPALDLKFAAGPGAGTFQDMLYAELDEFEPVAIQEHETADGWRVFFRTSAQRDTARSALAAEFGSALLHLTTINVDDEDWARRSQASLTAVRVGRIVVAPPWDASNPSSLITDRESSNRDSADPGSRMTVRSPLSSTPPQALAPAITRRRGCASSCCNGVTCLEPG